MINNREPGMYQPVGPGTISLPQQGGPRPERAPQPSNAVRKSPRNRLLGSLSRGLPNAPSGRFSPNAFNGPQPGGLPAPPIPTLQPMPSPVLRPPVQPQPVLPPAPSVQPQPIVAQPGLDPAVVRARLLQRFGATP